MGLAAHFRLVTSKLVGRPTPSPNLLQRFRSVSAPWRRKVGGRGPCAPLQCRSKREGRSGPPKPALVMSGHNPQGRPHSSSPLFSLPWWDPHMLHSVLGKLRLDRV